MQEEENSQNSISKESYVVVLDTEAEQHNVDSLNSVTVTPDPVIAHNESKSCKQKHCSENPKVDCDEILTENVEVEPPPNEGSANESVSKFNDDILPSLGILPEAESLDGANIQESKSDPLPSIIQSGAAIQNDPSEVSHKVKRIKWKDSEVPIITQNNNGPCPLLAILNAMVLKGKITLPRDRQELTGAELVSIVGNAVFDVPRSSVPSEMHTYLEQNTQDAVGILHKLLTGLDVNIKFSGVKDFEFTSELSIFDVLEVSLYHGWVVDPTSDVASIVSTLSYNQLTNNIIMWREEAIATKDDTLLLKAMLCEEFMAESVSQLTIFGLFELGSALGDEEVAVLFRNNHFSTVYKKKGQLYQLLTDQGFLLESAVWETLTDVDSTFSEFVNGLFQPIHQDYNDASSTPMTKEQQINSDHQLAAILQQEAQKQQQREEDFSKMVEDLGLHNLSDQEIARRLQNREDQLAEEANRSSLQASEGNTQPGRPYSQSHIQNDNHSKRKKDIYPKQEISSNSPLDVLDFSMSEGGGNPTKYPSQNGQDSLYHQLLSNTAKVSNKYLENNTSDKLNVPAPNSDVAVIDEKSFHQDNSQNANQNKIYECPYCPYKSTRSCNLTNHLQTHYLERPYADPSCTYCSTLNNYKIDRMSSNLENQIHPCSHCSIYSSSVEDAVKHLKSHLDESSCICTHSQRTGADSELYQAKEEEDETFPEPKKTAETPQKMKNFQCPNCTYIAHRAQNLKRHIITHTGERPHSCSACPYRAPDVSSLRVHMKTHTGERPYDCPHCSYKASQKSTLRNHLKVHTGEKPYPCSYCSYRSSNQTNLNSHIKTHTGEKPYSCPHCSYCATQSSALKCHLRIHTGEKPFACTRCPYKAAALGNLRSHLKVHANGSTKNTNSTNSTTPTTSTTTTITNQ